LHRLNVVDFTKSKNVRKCFVAKQEDKLHLPQLGMMGCQMVTGCGIAVSGDTGVQRMEEEF